jgi:BMFP domain-containing protein YqiC
MDKCKYIISENDWSKSDIEKIVRDTIKNDRTTNKDVEKKVKKLVANAVNTLFKTLWQRRNFYENEITR